MIKEIGNNFDQAQTNLIVELVHHHIKWQYYGFGKQVNLKILMLV